MFSTVSQNNFLAMTTDNFKYRVVLEITLTSYKEPLIIPAFPRPTACWGYRLDPQRRHRQQPLHPSLAL